MLSSGSPPTLIEMGRAGLQFAEQFEERRVLASFEEELRKLVAEVADKASESTVASRKPDIG